MAKKTKIPKKIAGMKVPKMLRKSAFLRMLLSNQMGREILANALTAAAGAAATVLIAHREEVAHAGGEALHAGAEGLEAGAKKTAKATSLAAHAARSAAGAFAEVVTDAARAAIPGTDRKRGGKRAKEGDAKKGRAKGDRADFLTH